MAFIFSLLAGGLPVGRAAHRHTAEQGSVSFSLHAARRTRASASPRACATASGAVLPATLQKIVTAFQMVPDPMQRYKQLLFYAAKLKALPAEHHTAENKVQGCVSQVWVLPTLREGRVYFQADSDSQLTKGLAALLVEGLSGCQPAEVLQLTPDFIETLGLKQSLTPSRNNGFLNMLLLMQKKTLELSVWQQAGSNGAPEAVQPSGPVDDPAHPVRSAMVRKLTATLRPTRLEIVDESAQHAGHGGGKGLRSSETHFKVVAVSDCFQGLSAVARHRLVYAALAEELEGGVHALTIEAHSPLEVE